MVSHLHVYGICGIKTSFGLAKIKGGGNLFVLNYNMGIKQITDFITMELGYGVLYGTLYLCRHGVS